MSLSLALVGLLSGSLDAPPAPGLTSHLAPFSLPSIARPAPSNAQLRSRLLETDEALHRRLALRSAQQPAEGGGGAAAAPAEEPEPSIDLIRARERLVRTHRTLGLATFSALSLTTILGTIAVVNQQTVFGQGNCANGNPVFGQWGCGGLTTLHGISAITTVALYATTGGFALSMPDPEHAAEGNDRRAVRLRVHRGLAYAHLIGMSVQALLGFLSLGSSLFQLTGTTGAEFRSAVRTTHMFVGYATWATFSSAMITELIR